MINFYFRCSGKVQQMAQETWSGSSETKQQIPEECSECHQSGHICTSQVLTPGFWYLKYLKPMKRINTKLIVKVGISIYQKVCWKSWMICFILLKEHFQIKTVFSRPRGGGKQFVISSPTSLLDLETEISGPEHFRNTRQPSSNNNYKVSSTASPSYLHTQHMIECTKMSSKIISVMPSFVQWVPDNQLTVVQLSKLDCHS